MPDLFRHLLFLKSRNRLVQGTVGPGTSPG